MCTGTPVHRLAVRKLFMDASTGLPLGVSMGHALLWIKSSHVCRTHLALSDTLVHYVQKALTWRRRVQWYILRKQSG